jgi:hypothetical protein
VVEAGWEAGTVDVDAGSTAGDVVVEDVVALVFEDPNVGVVEVELTKGGAFAM